MRAFNRIASALLGLALLVGGLAVVLEMALVAAGRRPLLVPLDRWYRALTTISIRDNRVLVISVLIGLAGLVLLVLELRRWRPEKVPAGDSWWVSRRSIERRAAAAAATSGIEKVHADVRGNRKRWRLTLRGESPPHRSPDQVAEVRRAVRQELDRLNAPADIPINVAIRTRGRVA